MRTRLLAGLAAVALANPARADGPPISVGSEDGPKPGVKTYRLTLDRPTAERFRDSLATADVKQVSDTLAPVATDPAQKLALVLATNNVESFRRKMAADGTIGPNGVEIVMTTHPGADDTAPLIPGRVDVRTPGPVRERIRTAARRAGEVLLNPWSWEIKPRD